MKELIIDISLTGEVTIEATGFKGKACEKETERILMTLGGEAKVDKKPDYFMPEAVNNVVKSRI